MYLYPVVSTSWHSRFVDAKRANYEVAVAVAEQAIAEGSAGVKWKKEEVRDRVKAKQWEAVYGTYKYDPKGEIWASTDKHGSVFG